MAPVRLDDVANAQFIEQLVAARGEVGAVPRGIALPLGKRGRHTFQSELRELHTAATPQRRQESDRGPVTAPQRADDSFVGKSRQASFLAPAKCHFSRRQE